ncbi:MAG: hypothetical protein FWB74_08180 [Defluviitaleaceae bacterium]|nr:hypothetical protein [Defluviitaleaceae bacterium]
MNKPIISDDFTIDDIHKIREYNYEMTKNMSFEDRRAYYERGASEVLERIEKLRAEKRN